MGTSSNTYAYDCNGNQSTRTINSQSSTLTYDAENRLSAVSGTATASFVYDGDGNRVKGTVNGTTTLFIGGYYELTGSQVTMYYMAGAQRVAMRKYTVPVSMAVEYLLGDHLGSTSVTTDTSGAKVSEIRYKPWGEVRSTWTSGAVTTPSYKLANYTFTGQYSYMDDPTTQGTTEGFDLMFYNARWYDPYLNHFTQPDTIVPNPSNPQAWDRYAYARNNPLKYTDPSGHCEKMEDDNDGLCINWNKDGTYQIVRGGRAFPNRVEKAIANHLLTGNPNFLRGIPEDYAFLQLSLEAACANLGYDCGNGGRYGLMILQAGLLAIANARMRPEEPSSSIPASVVDDALGDPDCLGCGYNLGPYANTHINITPEGLQHAQNGHTLTGQNSAGKSVFDLDVDLVDLITEAETVPPVRQPGGNFERIVSVDTMIGTDVNTGGPTNVYTVITNGAGDLITAFPGLPSRYYP